MIYVLYSAEELRRFYWSQVGTFGRKKIRSGSPKFLIGDREASESDLDRPFIKKWEAPLGSYA